MGDPSGFFTGFCITLFCTRWRNGAGESGRRPGRLRTEREQRAWQAAEEIGFGTCRGERKANAARGLDDTGGDFQETKMQRRELGSGQFAGFGNGVAHGEHQPISGGVENETDLIGERRTAARAIGGELCLMQLDQVLGLAAREIQAVVDSLGRADIEARDDEADVEAQHRRLNTGDGAPFAVPGLCLMARLGVAAQNRQVLDGASRADIVGDLVNFSGEWLGAGQAEDVVDAVVLAPRHCLRPGIVPIATERNARLVPTRADMPYQAAQMGAHLVAARRLAGPQHDRHGSALLRVVDVDRQEAALVIMSVEQRELLMAVDDIAGIVDVERDGCRLARVAIHPCIDQSVGQSDHVAQARSILQARQGWLGTQIAAGVRQPSAGQLECRIGPQMIEVVGARAQIASIKSDLRPEYGQ